MYIRPYSSLYLNQRDQLLRLYTLAFAQAYRMRINESTILVGKDIYLVPYR